MSRLKTRNSPQVPNQYWSPYRSWSLRKLPISRPSLKKRCQRQCRNAANLSCRNRTRLRRVERLFATGCGRCCRRSWAIACCWLARCTKLADSRFPDGAAADRDRGCGASRRAGRAGCPRCWRCSISGWSISCRSLSCCRCKRPSVDRGLLDVAGTNARVRMGQWRRAQSASRTLLDCRLLEPNRGWVSLDQWLLGRC